MERERLTITLRKDVLKLVDQSIDGAKLRNRSHAIEYFLSQSLAAKTLRAVVLIDRGQVRSSYQAGGMALGPKVSLAADVNGIFQTLADQGFTEIILAGTDAARLQANVVDAEKFGLNAKTLAVPSAEVALEQLAPALSEEAFIFWDARFRGSIDLVSLVEFHKTVRATATVALNSGQAASPIGLTAEVYGQKIISLGENLSAGLALSGVFIFEPAIFDERDKTKILYRQVLPELSKTGKLSGFVFVPTRDVRQVEAVMAK